MLGCARQPAALPVPAQRQALVDFSPVGPFVEMNSPAAPAHIVAGVAGAAGNPWRWTFARPQLRFEVPPGANPRFVLDFGIVPVTFAQTGPVVLSVSLDGKLLGRMRCGEPGDRRFESRVPEGWCKAGQIVTVTAEVDRRYVAQAGGQQLGYTLWRAGFLP